MPGGCLNYGVEIFETTGFENFPELAGAGDRSEALKRQKRLSALLSFPATRISEGVV
jgi:hypothetical protein